MYREATQQKSEFPDKVAGQEPLPSTLVRESHGVFCRPEMSFSVMSTDMPAVLATRRAARRGQVLGRSALGLPWPPFQTWAISYRYSTCERIAPSIPWILGLEDSIT
jgi:hypothetical protein